MIEREIYRMQTPYRDNLVVRGYQFGKGQKKRVLSDRCVVMKFNSFTYAHSLSKP